VAAVQRERPASEMLSNWAAPLCVDASVVKR
jgi:hypothetical protein